MFEGTREDLRKRNKPVIAIEVDQPERAQILLSDLGCPVTREGYVIRLTPDGECGAARINSMLVKSGISVSQLVRQHPTLEDFFLELTNSPTVEKEYAVR